MSERHPSFLDQLANGDLEDEQERELVLAELYLSGLFDSYLPWNTDGQPVGEVESTGDIDACPRRVGGSEHPGRNDASVGSPNPRVEGPTMPVDIQEGPGSLVPFAGAATYVERDGAEPEDIGMQCGGEAIELPRVAGRR